MSDVLFFAPLFPEMFVDVFRVMIYFSVYICGCIDLSGRLLWTELVGLRSALAYAFG